MVSIEDYGTFETAWCPGCGNFSILNSLKKALVECGLRPQDILMVSGIGQAAKTPHYLRCNCFNGLHGRAIPVAMGAKMVRPELKVIVESGDGCVYGEGGNHFISAIRKNPNITLFVHDNRVYGLTKGQASPTSPQGFITKAQPDGNRAVPFNPLAVAIVMGAGFVARGFAGMPDHLTALMVKAIQYQGPAIVDILQPCVSFNKVNTYAWYQEHCYKLDESHDPTDWKAAMGKAMDMENKIPLGVLYERQNIITDKTTLSSPHGLPSLNLDKLEKIMHSFA